MRLFISLIACLLCSGCMGTENYYKAQTAYYQAQAEAQTAYIHAQNQRQPLAEMIAPDGTKFIVNQAGIIQSPVIQTTKNPIVDGLKTIVNSTPLSIVAGGWAAKEIIKHSTGDVSASGESTVTTTANSNNQTELNNAESDINNSVDSSDNSQVADPLVVNQPEPIILTQPEPIIVNQPEPIIVRALGE